MLRKVLLLLLPILAFGCAGQGTYSGPTPYVGSFTGTWTSPATGHTGTLSLSISPHATIIGTYVDTTANVTGQISGTVAQSGSFHVSVVMSTTASDSMAGQFSVTSPGSAAATLAGNATVGAQAIVFTLPADTAAGTSPYAGSFTGNWTSTSNGHYGTLTMTVSTGANIVGAFVDTVAGTTASIAGSVTQTGSFTTTVTLPSGTEALAGQLSIANGVLSGNANLQVGSTADAISFTLSTATSSTSAYVGSYTGAWTAATTGHSGQISWTISPQATIIGTYIDATAGIAGSISGTVNSSGTFTTTIAFSSNATSAFTGQLTLLGGGTSSASLTGDGTLNNGVAQPLSFSLPASPVVSKYQGTFNGTWDTPANGAGNNMVWTIAPNGTIVGIFYATTNGVQSVGTMYGTTDNNGNYSIKVTIGSSVAYTLGGQMTYQVVTPPSPAVQYGNEVGQGALIPAGGAAQAFEFSLDGTINNVTAIQHAKPAAVSAASRASHR